MTNPAAELGIGTVMVLLDTYSSLSRLAVGEVRVNLQPALVCLRDELARVMEVSPEKVQAIADECFLESRPR